MGESPSEYMKTQLTPLQLNHLKRFYNDTEMREAVHAFLLAGLYTHGVVGKGKKHNPLINGAFALVSLAGNNPIPDAELGAHLRGQWFGINALEQAFMSLETVTSEETKEVESPYNVAE